MPYAVVILTTDRVDDTPPQVTQARALMVQHFGREPDVAASEWVPAASEDGQAPASAWWLATKFDDTQLTLAQQLLPHFPGSRIAVYDLDTNPLHPWTVLTDMNLQPLTAANTP